MELVKGLELSGSDDVPTSSTLGVNSTDAVAIENSPPALPSSQAERDILITEGILFWVRIYYLKLQDLKRAGNSRDKASTDPRTKLAISAMLYRLGRMNRDSPVLKSPVWKKEAWTYHRQTFDLLEITHQA